MSALSWKRRLGLLTRILPVTTPRKLILLYHTLGQRAPAISVARFREQLDWLAANARLTTLDRLLSAGTALPGSRLAGAQLEVAITFDDGYASVHDEVAPLLQQLGASATVYINTGRMGESTRLASNAAQGHYPHEQFLTWAEVQSLAAAGWCIGSHGVEHLDLCAVSAELAMQQLVASRSEIMKRVGQSCEHFAYTWGRFTPALQAQVKAAGYRSAASGLHGPVCENSDRFALPRIDIRADYELQDFVAAVNGQWDYLGYKQRLWRALI